MAEQRHADDGIHAQDGAGMGLKRRGLIAAAAALVAGIVANQTAQPIAAVTGGTDGNALINGANDIFGTQPHSKNTAANPTQLTNTSGTVTASPTSFFHQGAGLIVTASDGAEGIMGFANGPFGRGIWGVSNRGFAVVGQLNGVGGTDGGRAISANAASNTNAYGVYAQASGMGSTAVYGAGSQGTGVLGQSTNGVGVLGRSTGGYGVQGQSTNTIGVFGATNGSGQVAGVYGVSNASYGVIGNSTAAGYAGLTAITGTAGVAALAATSTIASAFAAYFSGTTVVQGDFVAFGGSKSAAVKDASGQHRLVYCVESPESWFEDFGTGTLVAGKAVVKLDPTFTQIVHTNDYHVFLTSHDPASTGLAVAGRRDDGFSVQEHGGGTRSGTFSYRVVAKRKDITGERLARFEPPKINHPDPDTLPRPTPPKRA